MPFAPSQLLNSLLNEEKDQIATQLRLWNASTLFPAIKGKSIRKTKEIYEWAKNRTQEFEIKNPEVLRRASSTRDWLDEQISSVSEEKTPSYFNILGGTVDYQVSKFGQLIELSGKKISSDLSIVELHELGNHIEQQAISRLREQSISRRKEKDERFEGQTLDDMVSHVVKTLIDDLMARFDELSDQEKDALIKELTLSFEELDKKAKAAICDRLKTDEITEEAIRRAINSGLLAGGIAGLVGISGFAAYTTITSVLSVLSFGLLPFSGYIFATSFLAFATKFYVLIPALLLGGNWITKKANEKINDRLFPIFVSLTIISSPSQDRNRNAEIEFERKFKQLNAESVRDVVPPRQLREAFPSFEWKTQIGILISKISLIRK